MTQWRDVFLKAESFWQCEKHSLPETIEDSDDSPNNNDREGKCPGEVAAPVREEEPLWLARADGIQYI